MPILTVTYKTWLLQRGSYAGYQRFELRSPSDCIPCELLGCTDCFTVHWGPFPWLFADWI